MAPSGDDEVARGARPTRAAVISNLLVALSFLVYAFAALSQHQGRAIPFPVEESGPIEAVLSHHIYGTPIGVYENALWKYFLDSTQLPADKFIEQALHDPPRRWGSASTLVSGTGVGSIVLVQAAFSMFGFHAHSFALLQIFLIGVSVLCFAARYQDRRLVAASILLASFTFLLMTTVSASPWREQAPIGGIRYYAIVGVLAALHWCFELGRAVPGTRIEAARRWSLLFIQTLILSFAILVRGSPLYLLAPVGLCAVIAWRGGVRGWPRYLGRLVMPAAVLIIVLGVFPRVAFPDYAKSGRLNTVVWHRAFISYGLNPNFPFPGMREKYDCEAWVPGGLKSSNDDRNGHCVWLSDPASASYRRDDPSVGIYGGAYEASLRRAFFDVILSYPREAFATFFYYKPLDLIAEVAYSLRPNPAFSRDILMYVVLQIGILAAFAWRQEICRPPRRAGREILTLLTFLGAALAPQWLAWTYPSTAIDITAYVFCAGAIVLDLIVAYVHLFALRWRRAIAA